MIGKTKMSFWKIAGGAAAGVGIVACLPALGAVGAVSAVGAAIGLAGGAMAGKLISESDDEKDEALKKAEAQIAIIKERCEKRLKEAWGKHKDHSELLIAMVAMGLAAANADGEIVPEEQEAIDTFVLGLAATKLPQEVKDKIETLKNTPPNLSTAIALAEKIDGIDWRLFDEIIQLVIYADEKKDDDELSFLQDFRNQVNLVA